VLDAEANPEEALLLNGLLCQANMLAGLPEMPSRRTARRWI
jgi:hypothetical protein